MEPGQGETPPFTVAPFQGRKIWLPIWCIPSITLLGYVGLRSTNVNETGSISAIGVCPETGVVQVI